MLQSECLCPPGSYVEALAPHAMRLQGGDEAMRVGPLRWDCALAGGKLDKKHLCLQVRTW